MCIDGTDFPFKRAIIYAIVFRQGKYIRSWVFCLSLLCLLLSSSQVETFVHIGHVVMPVIVSRKMTSISTLFRAL